MITQYGKYICASLLVLGLAACAADERRTVNKAGEKPAPRIDVAAPKGLNDHVYYDAEVQSLIASLSGMQKTLNRLEGDIQTLAMQRIAAMREEMSETNRQLVDLQNSLRTSGIQKPEAPHTITGDLATPEAQVAEVITTKTTVIETAVKQPVPAPVVETVVESVITPVAEKPKTPKAEPTKAAVPATKGVKAARVGAHADYVRVVLDIAGKQVKHTAHFDEAEKIVTVELPNTPWHAALQQSFANNPSLSGYNAQKTENGSIVVFTLKDGVKLRDQSWLSGTPDSRLILDFTR